MRARRQKKLFDPTVESLRADLALLTPKETARALKISDRTLCYWTLGGRGQRPLLSSVKLGKLRRYVVRDVLALIEKFKQRAA